VFAGGGYTAGNSYATTTDGDGTGATFKVDAIADTGVSIAKLQTTANLSAAPIELDALTTNGVSVRISGTGAEGHLVYE